MIFLPDTLVGVRQFLCGGRFDAYASKTEAEQAQLYKMLLEMDKYRNQ